jgi:hypothetical protein
VDIVGFPGDACGGSGARERRGFPVEFSRAENNNRDPIFLQKLRIDFSEKKSGFDLNMKIDQRFFRKGF